MSDEKKNMEMLRGLFEGGSFPNAQINVLTGDNVHVSYEDAKKQTATRSEDVVRRAMARLMDEKDEKGKYLIYDQDQFYGVKAVLVSPLCGFPAKPADFKRAMHNLKLDNLRIPYVYDSIRKVHPHQLPTNVELWHQYLNTADDYSLKQVRPAVRLIELIEEESEQ